MWFIPAAMAIGGMAAKGVSAHSKNKQARQQNLLNAQLARYAPFTGYNPQGLVQAPGTLGQVLGGGLAGAGMGLSIASSAPGAKGVKGMDVSGSAAQGFNSGKLDENLWLNQLNNSRKQNPYEILLRDRAYG